MSMNIKPENRRLLEALDYLDDSIVADMLAEIKVPDSGKSQRVRPLRYILALAASVLLLGAVIPLMTYIIETHPAWLGFAASSPTESDFENYIITEDDLAAINDAWNDRFGTGNFADTPEEAMFRKKNGRFYFGRYGYCIVIVDLSDADVAGSIFSLGPEDDYRFGLPSGLTMWFFKGSKVYSPDEAEKKMILDLEYIAAIHDYYQNYYKNALEYWEFVPTLEYISQERMREVSDAVVAYKAEIEARFTYRDTVGKNGEEKAREIAEEIYRLNLEREKNYYFRGARRGERYYGIFNDCVVVAQEGNLQHTTGYSIEGIGIRGTSFYAFVYRDGEVLDLNQAYDQGWLTVEDIAKIASRHYNYNAALDAKDYLFDEPYLEPIAELEALPEELFADRYKKLNTGFAGDDRYLGSIGYCWVFLEKTEEPNETESVNIAGYEFYTGKYRKMVAYTKTWDGYKLNLVKNDLAELYLEADIPEVLIKIIHQRNEEYESYFNLSPIKEMYEAAELYCNTSIDALDILEFYGTYNDYTVLASGSILSVITEFELGGYSFFYPSSTMVWACRGEEKILLTEAYEKGYITDADIAKIHESYRRYKNR